VKKRRTGWHAAIKNIPLEAYDDNVNGKPTFEWVLEHQSVTTDNI